MKIKSASNCQRSGPARRPVVYLLLRELKLRRGFHGGRAPYRPNRMCGDLPAGLMIFCPRKRHPTIPQSRGATSKPVNLISIAEDIKGFAEAPESYSDASLFSASFFRLGEKVESIFPVITSRSTSPSNLTASLAITVFCSRSARVTANER